MAMKPGISSDLVVVLPIAADRAIVVSYVAWGVGVGGVVVGGIRVIRVIRVILGSY